jgi:hypothetical protein
MERKRKEEEEAAATAAAEKAADEEAATGVANPDDEWGAYMSSKDKKKAAKKKAQQEAAAAKLKEEEEANAAVASAAVAAAATSHDVWGALGGETNLDDEVGATTSKKKKGKKVKAQIEELAAKPKDSIDEGFHEINLDDDIGKTSIDLGAPKIDLSFSDAGNSGGFSTGWSWSKPSWSFGADSNNLKAEENKKKEEESTGGWLSAGKKKLGGFTGFDFGFGASSNLGLAGKKDEEDILPDWGINDKKSKKAGITEIKDETKEEKAVDDDSGVWGTATTKKSKKSKKVTPLEEDKPKELDLVKEETKVEDQVWNTWDTKKTKKNKKGIVSAVSTVEDPVKDTKTEEKKSDDAWGAWNKSTKDTTKTSWADLDDDDNGDITALPTLTVTKSTEKKTAWGTTTWDTSFDTSMKDKKKKSIWGTDEPEVTADKYSIPTDPKQDEDIWADFTGTTKQTKKNKKKVAEEDILAKTEPTSTKKGKMDDEDPWGWMNEKKLKDEKKSEEDPWSGFTPVNKSTKGGKNTNEGESIKKNEEDNPWASSSTKKEKKGAKKKDEEISKPKDEVDELLDSMNNVDDEWTGPWSTAITKTDKKKKRDSVATISVGDATEIKSQGTKASDENDWPGWGTSTIKKKDKKSKKQADTEIPPVPAVPDLAKKKDDTGDMDTWGSTTFGNFWDTPSDKKKGTSTKKTEDDFLDSIWGGKTMKPEDVEEPDKKADDDILGFTMSTSKKNKKKVKNDPVDVTDKIATKYAPTQKADEIEDEKKVDDDWEFASNRVKIKKGKKGVTTTVDLIAPAPDPPEDKQEVPTMPDPLAIEAPPDDDWIAPKSKKDKKAKKSTKVDDIKLSKSITKDSKPSDDIFNLLDDPVPVEDNVKEDELKRTSSKKEEKTKTTSVWGSLLGRNNSIQKANDLKKEKQEKARKEQEAKEEEERLERERVEAERLEQEQREEEEREKALKEAELARKALEKEERDLAGLNGQRAKKKAEQARTERLERERQEAERLEQERREEDERREAERKLQKEKDDIAGLNGIKAKRLALAARKEREEKEKAEAERLEKERLEQEEQERIAREVEERRKEDDDIAGKNGKLAQRAALRARKDREEKEKAEMERLEQERIEQEAREKAEQEAREAAEVEKRRKKEEDDIAGKNGKTAQKAALKVRKERLEREKAEADRIEKEKFEHEEAERVLKEAEDVAEAERIRQKEEDDLAGKNGTKAKKLALKAVKEREEKEAAERAAKEEEERIAKEAEEVAEAERLRKQEEDDLAGKNGIRAKRLAMKVVKEREEREAAERVVKEEEERLAKEAEEVAEAERLRKKEEDDLAGKNGVKAKKLALKAVKEREEKEAAERAAKQEEERLAKEAKEAEEAAEVERRRKREENDLAGLNGIRARRLALKAVKEREEKEAEERAAKQEEERLAKEAEEAAETERLRKKEEDDLAGKNGSKAKKQAEKVVKEREKKKKEEAAVAEAAAAKQAEEKSEDDSETADEEPDKKDDPWSIWGVQRKPVAKIATKSDTKKSSTKLAGIGMANQNTSPKDSSKVVEASTELLPITNTKSHTSTVAKMNTKVTTKGSSIAERIKALQAEAEGKSKDVVKLGAVKKSKEKEVEAEVVKSTSKESSQKNTRKSAIKSFSKYEDVLPSPQPDLKKDSILPGGFIDSDDDLLVDIDPPKPPTPPPEEEMGKTALKSSTRKAVSSKPTKTVAKSSSKAKSAKDRIASEVKAVEDDHNKESQPAPVELADSKGSGSTTAVDDAIAAEAKVGEDAKTTTSSEKKVRPKVVRQPGTSSWGFWATSTPRDVKRKPSESQSVPLKGKPPAMIVRANTDRRKSTYDAGKSEGEKKSSTKPTPKRASTFSIFGPGPTPVRRSKSMRQTATPIKLHQESVDGRAKDDNDAVKVSAKAAKVMGIKAEGVSSGREASAKSKGKTKTTEIAPALPKPQRSPDNQSHGQEVDTSPLVAPDPYALPDDSEIAVETPSKPPKTVFNRKSVATSNSQDASATANEEFFVDADSPAIPKESPADFGTPKDIDDSPRRPLRRQSTNPRKSDGFMGIFNLSRSKTFKEPRSSDPTLERRKRRDAYNSEDEYVYRRDGRKSKPSRSPRETGDDGFVTEVPAVTTDYEDAERRRAEKEVRRIDRRRRPDEVRLANEQVRAREKDRERELRKQEVRDRRAREDELRREEEKEIRRAARSERRVREEEDRQREIEREERRAHRRDRGHEKETRDRSDYATERRSVDRRKSYAAGDERRRSRIYDDDLKRRSSRKAPRDRSGAFDHHFESRNSGQNFATPYLASGGDKTASWVNSVNENPPEPIPAEDVATIIEPKPEIDPNKEDSTDPEEIKRRRRRERRERQLNDRDSEERKRERRRREQGGSGDSAEDRYARRKTYTGYDAYDNLATAPRKQSFFKKLTTFGV